jgi:hypothetical protein
MSVVLIKIPCLEEIPYLEEILYLHKQMSVVLNEIPCLEGIPCLEEIPYLKDISNQHQLLLQPSTVVPSCSWFRRHL